MQHQIKTVGIIAEYNPFHNGHRYQIEELKHRTKAENIVIVMGGEFLQRGIPAITDKYLRTAMALSCGADIVFELPAVFSTASAETFAYGGISLLHQLGCIDAVCFGSECGDISPLCQIADYLYKETDEYTIKIRRLVSAGLSYPAARNQILTDLFPDITQSTLGLLTSPNNILAIEYLKALRQLNSPIKPITITRSDYGYHAGIANGSYLSASSVRNLIEESMSFPLRTTPQTIKLSDYIPAEAESLLLNNKSHFPLTENDFSEYLFYALNTLNEPDALSLSDMSIELWRRIRRELTDFENISSFTDKLKSKQYTRSRISRVLCHILLHIKKDYLQSSDKTQKIPALYGRILGLRTEKTALLRNITHLPIINKLADSDQILKKYVKESYPLEEETQKQYLLLANAHMQVDLDAAALYRRALFCKTGAMLPEEHRAGIIRL